LRDHSLMDHGRQQRRAAESQNRASVHQHRLRYGTWAPSGARCTISMRVPHGSVM
jgi:hypothetical protein